MSFEYAKVWKCDFCKHRWWKDKKDPPTRCAGCKKLNWHKNTEDPKLEGVPGGEAPKTKPIVIVSQPKCPLCGSALHKWGNQHRCPNCERNF